MVAAIIVVILVIAAWYWQRQERIVRELREEVSHAREELYGHAEAEIARLGEMANEIKRLEHANAHLEATLKKKRALLSQKQQEVEAALLENEVLCMKLARAVWQNAGTEAGEPCPIKEQGANITTN